MTTKKKYGQTARVQGVLRTLGARQGITIGELAEEFGVTKRTLYLDLKAGEEGMPYNIPHGSSPKKVLLIASPNQWNPK
ncbi:MAG: HTH domain-containing protein [Thermodesulfobacteriota bacterium]|jgi:transcriptional antiterminator